MNIFFVLFFISDISSFRHGSFSDYDSDISSPCSTNDGLDFLSFGVPEIFFPQDFDFPTVIPGADTSFCPLDEHLHSITSMQNANECSKNTNHLEDYINQEALQTAPQPSCMMPKQLPLCSIQGDMLPSSSIQGSLDYHHYARDPNIPGIRGGLEPVDKLVQDAAVNINSEEGTSKLSRNNSSQNKKARHTAKSLRKHSIPDQLKDEKYWRRRLRNNWSAKKSREAKRAKDSLIHTKISSLENENNNLKMIIARLLAERNSHQCTRSPWNNQIM